MLCPGLTLKTILVRWYCVGVVSAAQLVMISLTDVLTKTICAHMVCEVGAGSSNLQGL